MASKGSYQQQDVSSFSFANTQVAFAHLSTFELYKAYVLFRLMAKPRLVKWGTAFIAFALRWHLPLQALVKVSLFKQFCGGESLTACGPLQKKLSGFGISSILDYGVEAKAMEAEFDNTCEQLLLSIAHAKAKEPRYPFAVFKMTGLARFALLAKLSAKLPLSQEEEEEWQRARGRVSRICQYAADSKVAILIDAEESWVQGAIDTLGEEMMGRFNRGQAIVFPTLQMYRCDRLAYLQHLLALSQKESLWLGVKLVRGAYWEKERKHAESLGKPSPVYEVKNATDQAYQTAVELLYAQRERLVLFAGTHNEASTARLCQLIQASGSRPFRVVFSQLLGMSDHLTFNLAQQGYGVAKYIPYGPVKDVLPYLFRRAEENTAIGGQLGREFSLIHSELKRRKQDKRR